MQADQSGVHEQRRSAGLHDADDRRGLAGVLELREAELVADIEGDEAESDVGKEIDLADLVHRSEAEAADAEAAEGERADNDARKQERRHVRQVQMHELEKTRHHQTRKQRDAGRKQKIHSCTF